MYFQRWTTAHWTSTGRTWDGFYTSCQASVARVAQGTAEAKVAWLEKEAAEREQMWLKAEEENELLQAELKEARAGGSSSRQHVDALQVPSITVQKNSLDKEEVEGTAIKQSPTA
eukprot:936944-Rhodomonas_salina.1